MRRSDLADLALFVAVAEARSFTRASVAAGVSPSAISHAMRALEQRLGIRLLNRTTRSVAPTEAGAQLLAQLRPALRDVEDAVSALDVQRACPAGRLRISAHRMAAVHDIMPHMARFGNDYPDVTVELVIQDGLVDIVAEGFDAGIRHQHILEQDMISVRIGSDHRIAIVAAPDYLARHGSPAKPQDLLLHNCLNYRFSSSGTLYQWRFEKDGDELSLDAPGTFIASDADILLEAVRAGIGIGSLSEPQVVRFLASGELVRVLAEWSPLVPPNYLYYAGRRQVSPSLRAFINCMTQGGSCERRVKALTM